MKHGEVAGVDEIDADFGIFGGAFAEDFDALVVAVGRRRGVGGDAGFDDFGHGGDARADVFEILRAGLPVFVCVFVDGDGDGHGVVRVVAEMRAENTEEAFAGGAGDGEKKDGERDLRGDERVVGALGAGAAGDAASAALHEAGDVGARELKRGREAEDYGSEDREADAEK